MCAYNSLPLFVCLLYLSVSFICLLPRRCPSRKKTALVALPFLLQLKSHTLVRLPSSNTKPCPAECQIISASVPVFPLSPCVCFHRPLILTLSFSCYFLFLPASLSPPHPAPMPALFSLMHFLCLPLFSPLLSVVIFICSASAPLCPEVFL